MLTLGPSATSMPRAVHSKTNSLRPFEFCLRLQKFEPHDLACDLKAQAFKVW